MNSPIGIVPSPLRRRPTVTVIVLRLPLVGWRIYLVGQIYTETNFCGTRLGPVRGRRAAVASDVRLSC